MDRGYASPTQMIHRATASKEIFPSLSLSACAKAWPTIAMSNLATGNWGWNMMEQV